MRRIIRIVALCGVMGLLFSLAEAALAQRGGWGNSGGSSGGPGGGYGGRGGRDDNRAYSAEEIQQRLSRTESFLTTLDANHNGIIEADEASSDQAKNMLDRIFGRANVTPRYPMAIKEILQIQETYYKNRGNGATPGAAVGTSPAASTGMGMAPATSMGFGAAPASGMMSPPGMGFGMSSASAPATSTSPAGSAGSSIGRTPSTALPSTASPATNSLSHSSLPGVAGSAVSPETKLPVHKSGRFLTARERLPKGLPSWFLEKDVNGDGQITMDEYATVWTAEKAAEFDKYDLNHDGIITAEEVLKVEKKSSSTTTVSSH